MMIIEPFFTPNVTFKHLKVPCHTDSSQPTPTTLLPPSHAPTKDTVPTTTANRVRERFNPQSCDHPTCTSTMGASKQDTSKSISFWLALLLFFSSTDHFDVNALMLSLTFLVPLADTSNDGDPSWLWHIGGSQQQLRILGDTGNHPARQSGFYSDDR